MILSLATRDQSATALGPRNNGGRVGTATAGAVGGVAVVRGPGGRFGDRLLVRAQVTNAYSNARLIGITRDPTCGTPFRIGPP